MMKGQRGGTLVPSGDRGEQIGKRRILTGFHIFAGFDRKHVLELMEDYLDNHYDLSQCTVWMGQKMEHS